MDKQKQKVTRKKAVPKRKRISDSVTEEVLKRCRRKCCMCFGLKQEIVVKEGQIAHLNRNRNMTDIDNLVYLCLDCHKIYDSQSNRTIGYRPGEVRHYRDQLFRELGYDFVEWTLTLRCHRSKYDQIKAVVVKAHSQLKGCDPDMSVNEGPANLL